VPRPPPLPLRPWESEGEVGTMNAGMSNGGDYLSDSAKGAPTGCTGGPRDQ